MSKEIQRIVSQPTNKEAVHTTTERYLGCKQKLRIAVNDKIGLEPTQAS